MNVSVGNGEYTFKASGRTQTFKGFTAVYEDFIRNADDEEVVERISRH